MSISVIRKLTDEDREALDVTMRRFIKRWSIKIDDWEDPWDVIQVEVFSSNDKSFIRAWRRCFARALQEKESVNLTIAYDYVGHYVD